MAPKTMLTGLLALLLNAPVAVGLTQSQYETPRKLQEIQGERLAKLLAKELEKAESFLLRGEAEKAFKKASSVSRRITDNVIGGAGVGVFFGQAMAIQAIAEIELGQHDEGLWRWQIATQFFPELVAETDLAAFGEAGEYLASPPPREQAAKDTTRKEADFQPPRWTHQPDPRWPRAKYHTPTVVVAVSVVMGADGKLRNPKIIDADGELTMVFALLEAMRRWEFDPATIEGKPVSVTMRQTFRFLVRG